MTSNNIKVLKLRANQTKIASIKVGD